MSGKEKLPTVTLIGLLMLLGVRATTPHEVLPLSPITVHPGTLISADAPASRHVESYLALNPRDARNLIAASIVFGSENGVAVYASEDAGKTWARAVRGNGRQKVFPGMDPAVAFDADGNAYVVALDTEVWVWKSTDRGRTWGDGTVVPGSGDRPYIAGGLSGTDGSVGRLYVSAKREITVFGHAGADWHPALDMVSISSSRDRGAHFDFPRFFLPAPEKEVLNLVSDLLVTPEGRVILALQTFSPQLDLRAPLWIASYSTIVSSDEGRTFSDPRPVTEWRTYGHGREGKSTFGISGARLAMDTSRGPLRGRLYATWLDVVNGNYQVIAASSADGGRTWSPPVRVNDNQTATDQSNQAIAVDAQGVVGVSWNDRRGDLTDRCYQVFFAASVDGGASFSANQRLEEGFTCPIGRPGPSAAPDTTVDPIASEYRFKNGGDTQGIVGLPGGGFLLAWINGASGEMQLWSTSVTVDKGALAGSFPPLSKR